MEILTLIFEHVSEIALAGISVFMVSKQGKEKKFDKKMLLIKKKEELVTDEIDETNTALDSAEHDFRPDVGDFLDLARKAKARTTRTKEEIKLLEQ